MKLHIEIVPVVGQHMVLIRTETPHRGALPTIYHTVWQGVCEPAEGSEDLPEVEQCLEAAIGSTIGCLRNLRAAERDGAGWKRFL